MSTPPTLYFYLWLGYIQGVANVRVPPSVSCAIARHGVTSAVSRTDAADAGDRPYTLPRLQIND